MEPTGRGRPRCVTLVLGGTRSGKSEIAEALALDLDPEGEILYVATGSPYDPDMSTRIDAHRARRGTRFRTIEAGAALADTLRHQPLDRPVLIDSLGTWVASHHDFVVSIDELCSALRARSAATIVVSDEVGLGVHPSTEIGIAFRDVLGSVNRAVAEVADDVLLVVAGRVLPLARVHDQPS